LLNQVASEVAQEIASEKARQTLMNSLHWGVAFNVQSSDRVTLWLLRLKIHLHLRSLPPVDRLEHGGHSFVVWRF
jgi:hypothetical protein